MSWLDHDLASAREVQRTFLPPFEQEWRGVRMLAQYRPAHEVGGDFFEVTRLADGRVTALVGDVAGKGITAALIMARVSAELRRLAGAGLPPRQILAEVNAWLDAQALGDKFVTAACAQLDPAAGVWVAASAGHPAPLLRRADGSILRLAEAAGLPLGLAVVDRWDCAEDRVPARTGDMLLMMTDGLTDLLPETGVPEGLAALVPAAGRELEAVCQRVFAPADGAALRRDDATLVGIHLTDRAPRTCVA